MVFKKCKLKIPGKMMLWAWAKRKSLSTNYPPKFWYIIMKEKILEDAKKQLASKGRDIVMSFEDGGFKYKIHVKRK